jgi:hypothetical protein
MDQKWQESASNLAFEDLLNAYEFNCPEQDVSFEKWCFQAFEMIDPDEYALTDIPEDEACFDF